MNLDYLHTILMENRDMVYRDFMERLIPNVSPETILGVRTPQLRRIAREMGSGEWFLDCLPHHYFEENQIHAFLLAGKKDFEEVVARVEAFLPFVDNWATCDQLRPKVFQKHRGELLPYLENWISDPAPYTIRFGVEMLMCHFLDEDFRPSFLELAASVQSEEYYVKMMIAWYFATALAKQFDSALPYLEQERLSPWIHNKTIQKAQESYRIDQEKKEILKKLRR